MPISDTNGLAVEPGGRAVRFMLVGCRESGREERNLTRMREQEGLRQ